MQDFSQPQPVNPPTPVKNSRALALLIVSIIIILISLMVGAIFFFDKLIPKNESQKPPEEKYQEFVVLSSSPAFPDAVSKIVLDDNLISEVAKNPRYRMAGELQKASLTQFLPTYSTPSAEQKVSYK